MLGRTCREADAFFEGKTTPKNSVTRIKVMKIISFLAFFVLSIPMLSAADEPDNRTPIEKYRGDTQFPLLMCKLTLKLAVMKSDSGAAQDEKSDYTECIGKGRVNAKASLDRALRTIKKPKALEALKTYHVAFVTALEGIHPGAEERKISYEQRQEFLEGKVTEAWARFEIEK